MDPKRKANWKNRLVFTAKLLVVAAVFWWVGKIFYKGCLDLRDYDWELHWPWLAAAGVFYLAGLCFNGFFWRALLARLGQQTTLAEAMRAYFIGHLGKYVPGKAMVVILRAGMLRGQKVDKKVAAASVFLETLTMMASGAFLAALVLVVWFREQTFYMAVAAGLLLAAGLPTIPPLFRMLVRLARVGKGDSAVAERIRRIGFGTLVLGWGCMAVSWTFLALSLWATLRSFGAGEGELIAGFPRYLGSVSLAMVAGFIIPTPGGAGTREGVLMALMEPYFAHVGGTLAPQGAAVLCAVLLRIVWLASEVVISGVLFCCVTRPREEKPEVFEDVLRGPHREAATREAVKR